MGAVAPGGWRTGAGGSRARRRWGLLRWAAERQGSGGPSGLQNRQGVATRRLDGSIPSPLRAPDLAWIRASLNAKSWGRSLSVQGQEAARVACPIDIHWPQRHDPLATATRSGSTRLPQSRHSRRDDPKQAVVTGARSSRLIAVAGHGVEGPVRRLDDRPQPPIAAYEERFVDQHPAGAHAHATDLLASQRADQEVAGPLRARESDEGRARRRDRLGVEDEGG